MANHHAKFKECKGPPVINQTKREKIVA